MSPYMYMNWSLELVAEVPAGVVTVKSTVPVPPGLTTTSSVSVAPDCTLTSVLPNPTEVTPVKPVPVMVTVVPPTAGPLVGLIPVTTGIAPAP